MNNYNFISTQSVLDMGCGAVRCARWVLKHKGEKTIEGYGNGNYYRGWYAGKYYAYMYALGQLGLVEILMPKEIKNYKSYLKSRHKGKLVLFKGKFGFDVIISRELLDMILAVPNENYSKEIIQDIRRMSPEVK